jgi:hypothetical protein
VSEEAIPRSPSIAASARSALQVFTIGVGPAGALAWPLPGLLVLALVIVTAGLIVSRLRDHDEQPHAWGILAALASFALLPAAIGAGRAGLRFEDSFAPRYAHLVAPLLSVVFLVWLRYGSRLGSRGVPVLLLIASAASLPVNTRVGHAYGRERAQRFELVRSELRRGAPPQVVANRHWRYFWLSERAFASGLRRLRETRMSIYEDLDAAAECSRTIDAPVRVERAHDVMWRDGEAVATGPRPILVLALPRGLDVCAASLRVTLRKPARAALVRIYWGITGVMEFTEDRHWSVELVPSAAEQRADVWIDLPGVDRLRIDPDTAPLRFRVHAVRLFVR